jgi:hypothetical protein
MRLIEMNNRSRYKGINCMHCNRSVVNGRVALCSTFYVRPFYDDGDLIENPVVTAWSLNDADERERSNHLGFSLEDDRRRQPQPEEVRIRVVYHRSCVEKILTNPNGPYDPEVIKSMYDEYREQLLERFKEWKPTDVGRA